MANVIYPTFKSVLLSPGVDLLAATVKACLVCTSTGGTNYVYSAAHQFFSSVTGAAVLAAGVALTSKTVTAGAFACASVVLPSVAIPSGGQAGATGQALVFYVDTGTAATSQLIAYMDTETGLPVTPNGANITINFSTNVLALS